ncbi:hypothetical protein [Nocardia macrotermitis]|uniref:Uncharacterized protein n=1 Tax=Nocardia macrotermitis TaxID=2585198 RepID=A0A7K0DEC6_9NOCA|nr:hypothetical protein [Nocardia macrotermitis]MQY24153.1 hypothetical protein [Nocardia macrotermitis]
MTTVEFNPQARRLSLRTGHTSAPRSPIHSTVTEILDYFGKCPQCGYHATAAHLAHTYSDGSSDSETIATCGQPCGWQGPVVITRMTYARKRR